MNEGLRRRVLGFYEKMREGISREDFRRIYENFGRKLITLKEAAADNPQIGKLVRQTDLLWKMFAAWKEGHYHLPGRSAAALGAALLYILNPLDIIPDYFPIVGYIDDALISAFCYRLLRIDLIEFCDSEGLDKSYYGLGECPEDKHKESGE